nr:RHS repeat-associated core domain-containing protein [Nocardia cerradoensis]
MIRKEVTRLSRKPDIWHFRYNGFDQLTDVYTPGKEWWRYTYDALGRRIAKQHLTEGGTSIERIDYTWESTRLIEQTTGTAAALWTYNPGSDIPMAQSTINRVDREFVAIVTDLVGTPIDLMDPTAAVAIATVDTDLWGSGSWRGATSTPLRFPGQLHDPESGLNYNYNRYYDPGTGRFSTQDPLGLLPAPNPQSYPYNPICWTDPLGLIPNCPVRVSSMDSDWATKGAHVHIGGKEVRVFARHDGTIGVEGLRMSNGVPNSAQLSRVLDELHSNPDLRTDLIAKSRAAMTEMNAHNWGNSSNRAAEMHFLIRALEKMG